MEESLESRLVPYPFLSAKYKGSYAYKTVKDRMPVILTKVIDFLCRTKGELQDLYGEMALDDLKTIIGKLSKLRSDMQTNKPLQLTTAPSILAPDLKIWNEFNTAVANFYQGQDGNNHKWFESPWLFVECLMYRLIQGAVEESICLKKLDVFFCLKQEAFHESKFASQAVSTFTLESSTQLTDYSSPLSCALKNLFLKHLEFCVWGNKNDLSVSAGSLTSTLTELVEDSKCLQNNILINDSELIWNYVNSLKELDDIGELHIIMDNCGLELIADLCLATFCLSHNFFKTVVFHVKRFPWFVSDVTLRDFHWTLEVMKNDPDFNALRDLALKCIFYLDSQQFVLLEDFYYCTPLPYHVMSKEDPNLYTKLNRSKMIIFKGDLNYRKLGTDLNWPKTISFQQFLQGFNPAPLVALRTVKSEIICGLPEGKEKELEAEWMEKGDYGLIQFHMKTNL